MKEKKIQYNPWPNGLIPSHLQRPELEQLKKSGYKFEDAREVVTLLEEKFALFSGSKYAIAVDCCSNALFLCLKYLKATGDITIPAHTYISVPMQILHAGCTPKFEYIEWSGIYQLKPYPIYDSATRYTKDMYIGNGALQIISLQIKKRIPTGKGGIILTDDENAYNFLKLCSYDGRDLNTPYMSEEHIKMLGYHMYMTPEDAARTILLMDQTPEVNSDTGNSNNYFDLSKHKLFI